MLHFALKDMIQYDPERRMRKKIFEEPSYVSELVCYEPGQVSARHYHPDQDEIWLVMEGHGKGTIGDEPVDMNPYDMFFIPAGVKHDLHAREDSRMILLFVKTPGLHGARPQGGGGGLAVSQRAQSSVAPDTELTLEVADVHVEARDILSMELRAPGGARLPAFEPGAHLPINLSNGLRRHYSIASDWRDRDRYVVGVNRAPDSQGGSEFIHQSVRRGTTLRVLAPRNNFPLVTDADKYLFIAGGIGITPLLAMIRWCSANGKPWRLYYAVRNPQRAAFMEALESLTGGTVHLHADSVEQGRFDPVPVVRGADRNEHIYCCGPAPLMAIVKEAGAPRDPQTMHFEFFAAARDAEPAENQEFLVECRRSGKTLKVPADRSLLEVLEQAGISGIVSSCREGTCRTCETAIVEGAVAHRDYCLTPEEQASGKSLMICVSRARDAGRTLVLDL